MKSLIIIFLPVLFIAACVAFHVYKTGVQQQVYHRQGIEISRWEVFIGCTPAVKMAP